MYKSKTIAVVVPAYNEEGLIGGVIDTMPDFVDRTYVVDDGSTDGTWAEIKEHAREADGDAPESERRFVAIRHEENRGAGAALKTGYLRSLEDGMDVMAVMAGDGQMDPDILDKIIDPVVDDVADYSKGNRLLYPELREGMPRSRFLGNAVLTFLTKMASGYWKMMDPQNGYTAISNKALTRVGIEDFYDGFGTPNEMLTKLNVNNMRVAEVPMPSKYGDETSHVNVSSYIFSHSVFLLKNFLWRLKTKYLILDFHPLVFFYFFGFLVTIVGTLAGLHSLTALTREGVSFPARASLSLLIFTLGSMFLMFGMLFDMQDNEYLEIRIYD